MQYRLIRPFTLLQITLNYTADVVLHRMAKKTKAKAKGTAATPLPLAMEPEDKTLVDDLLVQLDSRDQTVQQESARVLNEMALDERAGEIEGRPKQTAKDRFQARQVSPVLVLANFELKIVGQESCCSSSEFSTG